MAKTFTAPFPQTPKNAVALVTAACVIGTANTPTNTVQLMTAGPDGAIVTNLSAIPRGAVTASSLLLFLSKDSGATKVLIDSELMAAYSLSATTAIPETQFARYNETTPLRLEAGDQLWVGSQVSPTPGIVFKCESTDY